MNTTETAKFFLIITFACLFLAAPGACADQLPNLDHDLQQLEQWRLEQHQRLKSEGGTTAQHQAVDREYLNRARALEAKRTKVLDELGKKAGVGSVKQGAHGTDPMQGRGAAGDIDTKSYTPSEYDRLLKHAKKMYGENNIEVRGDSFTIKGKGLNTTVHRAPTKFKSPAGSTAGEDEFRGLSGTGKDDSAQSRRSRHQRSRVAQAGRDAEKRIST